MTKGQEYTMEQTVSSVSGAGKTEQLHVKEWNQNTPLYHTQKQTPNELKI